MKTLAPRIMLVAIAPLILGGCSSLFGIRFASNRPEVRPIAQPPAERAAAAASSTEAGRLALSEGRPAEAIEAFQRALSLGEPSANALNGLGVAYARIGRKDLAVRYFEQAMAAEPLDSRFAANLDRVLRAIATDSNALPQLGVKPELARDPATGPARSVSVAPEKAPRLARGEIRIVTSDAPASAGRTGANSVSGFHPVVRLEFARAPADASVQRRVDVAANFRPIVRINLDDPARSKAPQIKIAAAEPNSGR